jgi:hypothetical protein
MKKSFLNKITNGRNVVRNPNSVIEIKKDNFLKVISLFIKLDRKKIMYARINTLLVDNKNPDIIAKNINFKLLVLLKSINLLSTNKINMVKVKMLLLVVISQIKYNEVSK